VKGCLHETILAIPVLRRNGSHGDVSCKWKLERLSAIPGCDYLDEDGVILFPAGTIYREVNITILPQRENEPSEAFQLVLDFEDGGVQFNPHDDGKEEMAIMTITIVNGLDGASQSCLQSLSGRCCNALIDPELLQYGMGLWKHQLADSFNATDGEEAPSFGDNAMHYISFPWKFLFGVCMPPPVFLGGWFLFFAALAFIGALTALVADLATGFGCCMSLENTVTAIIVVAPGTSLPDLFASQAAALSDEHADASIVNVTGSNSVNVFLGIGLPWTIASVYWRLKGEIGASDEYIARHPDIVTRYPNGAFIVEAGSLSFSVIIFSCTSVICLAVMRLKRHWNGGELGGSCFMDKQAVGIFFISLWVWYLFWNILKSSSDDADVSQWISIALAGVALISLAAVEVMANSGAISSNNPSKKERPARLSQDFKRLDENSEAKNGEQLAAVGIEVFGKALTWPEDIEVAEDGCDSRVCDTKASCHTAPPVISSPVVSASGNTKASTREAAPKKKTSPQPKGQAAPKAKPKAKGKTTVTSTAAR